MNELYEYVEAVIITDDQSAVPSLISKLEEINDPQMGTLFGCPSNLEYVLKRFINASMSVEEAIKKRSANFLGVVQEAGLLASADHEAIYNFIVDASNYKRHALKKSECEGFALGRIMILRALSNSYMNNLDVIENFQQMAKEFPHYEQQIMDVCFLLASDTNSTKKLQAFNPQSKSSKFLHRLFLNKKQISSIQILPSEFQEVIQYERSKYPQKSVALQYLGKWIMDYISPKEFFGSYAEKFLTGDNVEISEIYYLLVIYKEFLGCVAIDRQNYLKVLDNRMMIVWLDQFRVLNKRMKSLAHSISIKFDNDPLLASDLLKSFHQSSIYLENVSLRHPFHPLYQNVDTTEYWNYLYNLCISDPKVNKEQQPSTHYHELTYFLVTREKQIKKQQLATSLSFLISQYSITDKKQLLYLISNIINNLWKRKKKVIKFNLKGYLIIANIPIQNCNVNEQFQERFKKCLKWLRLKTMGGRKGKEVGDETEIQIHFWNFYLSMLYFALIYPEEIGTCEELEIVEKNFFVSSKPKKKVKRENPKPIAEQGRPISVLTDIFISLMTRPLQFLRNAIHTLYASILPELNENDISSMITVLATPDAEFIQDI